MSKRKFIFLFSFLIALTFSTSTYAQNPKTGDENIRVDFGKDKVPKPEDSHHLPVRKIVVFPFDSLAKNQADMEKAWWKVREELTANKRFLIASKQLMNRKDVFISKREIDRPSAILLGKHMDAEALVTAYLADREFKMTVYSATTGAILWSQSLNMNSAQPIAEQIENTSLKLIRDFVAQIPYQGYQILDPIVGKPLFDEGSSKRAKVEVAADARVEKGDLVQWVTIQETTPVYQNLNNLLIVAEGNVVEVERGILTVEIKRLKDPKLLSEKALIRIPKEAIRLQETMALKSNPTGMSPEIIVAEMRAAQPDSHEHKGMVTTGVTLGSIVTLILLAF